MKLSLHEIKGRLGHIINQKTEPWFGVHVSLQQAFPFWQFSAPRQERFLTVRMDITNQCNLRCKMCYFSLDEVKNKPRVDMPLPVFRKIARQVFPVATQLVISAGTEPLIAKDFPQMLEIAGKYDIPHLSFFTNGMLLNEKTCRAVIQAGVHMITVSIDGATPTTYESIRRGASFERVVRNIERLQALKAQSGSARPAIHVGVVLMASNIHEFPDLLRLAKRLGAAHVTASHLVPYSELDIMDETLSHHQARANAFLDQARQCAQEIGLACDIPPNFPEAHEHSQETAAPNALPIPGTARRLECYWPYREMLIRPDGSVHPCCYWYEDTSMGDFARQTFKEIWHGPQYRQLRDELASGAFRPTCRQCPGMTAGGERLDTSEIQIVGS